MARPKQDITKDKKSVTLRTEVSEYLTNLGHGNLSAGIDALYRIGVEANTKSGGSFRLLSHLGELSFADAVKELDAFFTGAGSREGGD